MNTLPIFPLSTDWEVGTLGELTKRGGGGIQTGPFGSQLHASDYVEEGIPSIMPQNISSDRISDVGIARITEFDAVRLSKYRVHAGDVVYSRRGDVERRALVRPENEGWLCGTGCLKVDFGKGFIDPEYAAFYLSHPASKAWVVQHAVGATMPNLNTSILAALPFVLPPMSDQTLIASILSSLDDKIELNRQMNEVLEGMARAVFRDWFVDFGPTRRKMAGEGDPVKILGGAIAEHPQAQKTAALFPDRLGENGLPEGWEMGTLDERFAVTIGRTPPRKEKWHFRTDGHGTPWLSIRDLGLADVFVNETKESLENSSIASCRVPVVREGTVLVSFKLTVGRVAISGKDMATNEAIAHLNTTGSSPSKEFTYCWMEQFDYGSLGSTSSIATAVNSKTIKSMTFPNFGDGIEASFKNYIEAVFDKIRVNTEENQTLAGMRDLLLPKLMSGEIRLREGG